MVSVEIPFKSVVWFFSLFEEEVYGVTLGG